MKKLYFLVTVIGVLFLFVDSASAVTYVVHKANDPACTTGDYTDAYYDGKSYLCIAHDGSDYDCGPIQNAVERSSRDTIDDIIVCPGTYEENIHIWGPPRNKAHLTIKSYSKNPLDTIIKAKDPTRNVFFVKSKMITITGFTIEGATEGVIESTPVTSCDALDINTTSCVLRFWKDESDFSRYGEDCPPQPCAGIRMYGNANTYIKNNIITGNNHGIIVKDTADDWSFYAFIENNIIRDNEVGVHFRYGNNSYIWNNDIYDEIYEADPPNDNPVYKKQTGISFVDTFDNNVVGNTIDSNSTGIELKASMITRNGKITYPPGVATAGNILYNNNLLDNVIQAYDDHPAPIIVNPLPQPWMDKICIPVSGGYECRHYWYEPGLLIGNYWSDWDGITVPWPEAHYDSYPRSSPYNVSNPPIPPDECADNLNVKNMILEPLNIEYYSSIQAAYNDPDNGCSSCPNNRFQIRAALPSENLIIGDGDPSNNDPSKEFIYLHSGYDCNYTANNGSTKLKVLQVKEGTLIIKSGTLILKREI